MSATGVFDWLRSTATAPAVRVTTLPASYFKFPPSNLPAIVPPPSRQTSFANPFSVPTGLYNALLSPSVPITMALVYASVVMYLNSVNARRKYKPWAISRLHLFKLFVILHNVTLALYSLWTCVGMFNALRLALPNWRSENTVASTVDALCKLHGPRGYGSAATYNVTNSAWGMANRVFHLAADGLTPESTDTGRIWNEGLAFYGWLFYLSKFYEVIDTLIILAKGKKSSFLQTYHHAGAMLSMWAGIRYMSPPIWMFVLVNSGIHFIMYSFYLCSVIGVRVPKWFKRSLTTLQITQFVVGASYAFAHLFVAYQRPVSVPYLYHLGNIASSIPADASSVISSATATASAGLGAWLKKAAFRAAGREGLAENVVNEFGRTFGIDAQHAAKDFAAREETRYREEVQWTHCLDTSGQVFAILLNVMYLLPLTVLFAQFFVKSYQKRVERRRSSTASENVYIAGQSSKDALKGLSRRVSELVEEMHGTADDLEDDEGVVVDADEVKKEIQEAAEKAREKIAQGVEKAKEGIADIDTQKLKEEVQADLESMRQGISAAAKKAKELVLSATSDETKERLANAAQSTKQTAIDTAQSTKQTAIDAAQQVKDQIAGATSDETKDKIKTAAQNTKQAATDTAQQVKDQAASLTTDETKENVKSYVSTTTESVKQTASDVGDKAAQVVQQQAKEAVSQGTEQAKGKAEEVKKEGGKKGKEAKREAHKKAEEAKSESGKKTEEMKVNATTGIRVVDSPAAQQEKKVEDKIISDSQTIRDREVSTKPGPKKGES